MLYLSLGPLTCLLYGTSTLAGSTELSLSSIEVEETDIMMSTLAGSALSHGIYRAKKYHSQSYLSQEFLNRASRKHYLVSQ